MKINFQRPWIPEAYQPAFANAQKGSSKRHYVIIYSHQEIEYRNFNKMITCPLSLSDMNKIFMTVVINPYVTIAMNTLLMNVPSFFQLQHCNSQ